MVTRSTAAVRLLAGDKEPVRFKTTGNHSLSGIVATNTDDVVPVSGDRALVNDQTAAITNGVYTVSEGAWQRAPDANTSRLLRAGMKVHVQEGTEHAGDVWSLVTDSPNLGDDDIEFEFYTSAGMLAEFNAAAAAQLALIQAAFAEALAIIGSGAYVQAGTGAVVRSVQTRLRESAISLKDYGAVGDGVIDDTAAIINWAADTVAQGRSWYVPPGTYRLNHTGEIILKTSGVCDGVFDIPKANHECRFVFYRDEANSRFGTVVSTAGWTVADMIRGATVVAGMSNVKGKILYLRSTEIEIKKGPVLADAQIKTEFIRVSTQRTYSHGSDLLLPAQLTTALTHHYTLLGAALSVWSYTPSKPIIIDGLSIIRSGAGTALPALQGPRGNIVVWRDNVTLNSPSIVNPDGDDPIRDMGIEASYCADTLIVRPTLNGYGQYDPASGYGIYLGEGIGATIIDPQISDCRRAIAGNGNVDTLIIGGNCHNNIDSHWGNRMTIRDTVITSSSDGAAITFCGNDLFVDNVTQYGQSVRCFVAIRQDTPSCGGSVIIRKPKARIRGTTTTPYYYVVGWGAPGGPLIEPPDPFYFVDAAGIGQKPTCPDLVVIEDPDIQTDDNNRYMVIAGPITGAPHTTWGTIQVRGGGSFKSTAATNGIWAIIDGRYAEDRFPILSVDGPFDFGGNSRAVFVTATDLSQTNKVQISLRGVLRSMIEVAPRVVYSMRVHDSQIADIIYNVTVISVNGVVVGTDDGVTYGGDAQFFNSDMTGGAASYGRNLAFRSCTFTGAYAPAFDVAYVTFQQCLRIGTPAGVPVNITNNVVTPYTV